MCRTPDLHREHSGFGPDASTLGQCGVEMERVARAGFAPTTTRFFKPPLYWTELPGQKGSGRSRHCGMTLC